MATSNSHSDFDRLREDILALKEDVSGMAREGASRLRSNVERGAQDLGSQAIDFVRERPVTTLLVAAGAGALLGLLCGRRSGS